MLSPRFLGTPVAHAKREALLGWLPAHLEEIDALDMLPLGILHDVYMHCSYADLPQRHAIKRPINRLIRKQLAAAGLDDIAVRPVEGAARAAIIPAADGGKPVMLVLLEWFGRTHSIYRTHAKTLAAARAHFHVVALASAAHIDEDGRAVFDEVVELVQPENVREGLHQLHALAAARKPAVFYMPSVGMFPITMFAANLRLAPLQVAALGHPATMHAEAIDYISVEDDFVGDAACFSEALLRLPKDGQPYWPPLLEEHDGQQSRLAHAERIARAELADSPDGRADVDSDIGSNLPAVNIAVAATIMKLNPRFLSACRQIQALARRKIRFHFLVGQAQGLMTPQVLRLIRGYLPDAEVYPHRPYDDYMATLEVCDMFISPFPFGNTNGVVDAMLLGVPGVCKTGPEVFEHIDEGLFRRLGLPDWTIAATVEAYIAAAVRMADNGAERAALCRQLARPGALDALFSGRPECLGEQLLGLLQK